MSEPESRRSSPRGIWRMLCPECRRGRVFSGSFRMNERCPVCGYQFERGPGYFTGAMYFSYAMGVPIIVAFMGVGALIAPSWPLYLLFLAAWVCFLPLVPLVYRYARVMFMYFDQYFDPNR